MSFEYQTYAALGLNLTRQKNGPLDISNVFASENDLKYYLTNGAHTTGVSEYWFKPKKDTEGNIILKDGKPEAESSITPYPYEGQIIATIYDGVKVFVLKEKADGTFETANVGDTSAVDAAVAALEEALNNAVTAINNKIGNIPTEEKDGEQVPVAENVIDYIDKKTQGIATDAALGELQTAVDNLEEAVGAQSTETAEASGIYKLIEEAEARAKAYADENDANTVYDDTALAGRVSGLEGVVGKAAEGENAATGLVKAVADNTTAIGTEKSRAEAAEQALEAKINEKAAQSDLTALTNRVDAFLSGTGAAEDALDSLQELIAYIDEHDGADLTEVLATIQRLSDKLTLGTYVDGEETKEYATVKAYVEAAIAAINIDNYATVEALEAESSTLSSQITVVDTKASNAQKAIDDYATTHAADYTNTQIDDAISSAIIAENLSQYAIGSEVQSALDGKQDTITATEIEHTSDNKTEGVTLANGKLSVVIDAYTKAETYTKNEVNTAISNKISEMTGGESAADVLSALNDYKKATDAEIYGAQFVVDSTTTSNEKEIYAPDYTKDSRIDIVTRVASTNSSNLEVLLGTGAGSVAEAKKAGTDAAAAVDALLKGQVTTNKNDIAALVTRVGTVESTVGGHTTEIATLTGKVTALEGADTAINTTLGEHTASITALGQKDAELAGLISGNTTAITNETTARTNADNALAARIKVYEDNKDSYATKAEVKVNTDAIAVLNGADTGKSVRAIAAEELASIVNDNNNGSIDTLNEIAAWIINDTTGAAKMANDIASLNTKVDIGDQTVSAAIATAKSEAIADAKTETENQVKAALNTVEAKYVTADTENNLSINGQTIVLCGGNAGITVQNGEAAE